MKYRFLFPCQDRNLNEVDESFANEAKLCKELGLIYYLFDFDTFVESTDKFKSNINWVDDYWLIYRGWMLTPLQYTALYKKIETRKVSLVNTPYEYTNCHCFPMVYDMLKDVTPRIVEITTWEDIYNIEIPFDFFLKDHVKSEKDINGGVERISKDINRDELVDKIALFVKKRGKLFTGQIVLKEFVNLKRINGKTNEWRVFYFYGEYFHYYQNSFCQTDEHPPFELIEEIGEELQHMNQFFTVDFAQTEDDEWIVIETGDGQVSGLPINEETAFYNNFNKKLY